MHIGEVLKERMDCFNISEEQLSEESLIELDELYEILNNNIKVSEIDEISLSFISQVLYCSPEYFYSRENRFNDIVYSSLNRGDSTPKSNQMKGLLQMFCEDFSFLIDIKQELRESN